MSECEQASRLGAYHDGELSPEAVAEVEAHLCQCPPCAAELRRLRGGSWVVGALVPPQIAPSAVQRLHRVIDRLPSAGLRRLAEALAAVAATILVACTIGLALRTSPQARTVSLDELDMAAVTQPSVLAASTGPEELLAGRMVQDPSGRDADE